LGSLPIPGNPVWTQATDNVIGIMPGDGLGGFSPPQLFGAGQIAQQVALADLDGNGGLDVVAAARVDNTVTVLMNNRSLVGVGPRNPVAALTVGRGYPNPAPGSVTIPFAIPRSEEASLRIYDAAGRVVRTLLHGVVPAGGGAARWDRRTDQGERAGSGLYFYELRAGEHRATGRLVLL
jgi:hypothetical protein